MQLIIHVVKQGDTLNSIAREYNTSPILLRYNNSLPNPDSLVVGQNIVILTPEVTHTVEEGETLLDIANRYNVSVNQLLRNNPVISETDIIYPGQTIVISYDDEKRGTIAVNGYAYPYINRRTLIRTLPYLSFLTIFTYGFKDDGSLVEPDDEEIISIALDYGVAPIMLISTLSPEGTFSNELANFILNNQTAQDILIENILQNVRNKNYYGVDVDFEYVFPSDREAYINFLARLSERLNSEGYFLMTALAPKISSEQQGLLYEAHDYAAIGEVSNAVLLMTYEWGYTYCRIC